MDAGLNVPLAVNSSQYNLLKVQVGYAGINANEVCQIDYIDVYKGDVIISGIGSLDANGKFALGFPQLNVNRPMVAFHIYPINGTFDIANSTEGGGNETVPSVDSEIRLYPNPSKGSFEILSSKEPISSVVVIDAAGNEVYRKDFDGALNVKIERDLAEGLYIVKAQLANSEKVFKLVVN